MTTSNTPRPCCDEIRITKLGRCRTCVVLSALLSGASWAAYVAVSRQRAPMPGLPGLLLVLSGLFTLLLLAHAVAFARRRWRASIEPSAAVDLDPR